MDSQSWSSKCLLKKICFSSFWGQTRGKNSLEVVWEIKGSSLCSHPQNSIFTTYVGLSPYWGYVCPFCARGRPLVFFVFFFSWYGLGWYRVRVETPQEDICFSLVWSGAWGWRGGGEKAGRDFSWVVWSGGPENSVFFNANSEKIDKNLEIFTKL